MTEIELVDVVDNRLFVFFIFIMLWASYGTICILYFYLVYFICLNVPVIVQDSFAVVVPEDVRRLFQTLGDHTLYLHYTASFHVNIRLSEYFNLGHWKVVVGKT